MQYTRPPLGPNPSSSITSSREMSSLTSANIPTENSYARLNKISNEQKKKPQNKTHSAYPLQQDSQNFQQQDQDSRHGLIVAQFHSVGTNSSNM